MIRRLPFAIIFFLTAFSVFGFEWTAWDLDVGVTWQFNGQIGSAADRKQPSKLMFNPGASVFADFDGVDGGWYFRPGGWFSWNIEDLQEGVARPCDEAEADHMKVLGLMGDAHFGYAFDVGSVVIGVQGGPSIYFRFPLWTAESGTATPGDFWKAYYAGAEFLHLGIASWAAFRISDGMDATVGLKLYQPLSPVWTEAPFFHGFQVSLTGSLRFRLDRLEE